jgi:WD40 repeat protein
MASTSTNAAAMKSILTPSITLKGHGNRIQSISYFPGGKRMISGCRGKTARRWDLKAGKEIEEARSVCEGEVWAVAVSRNGRWIVTGGGDWNSAELKACEVETGITKTFKGHSGVITCIDISVDNTQLASGSWDKTARIWNMDTGKLVAGPFKSENWVGAVRFSPDSKKLAVKSDTGRCLEVWNVQSQKLDIRVEEFGRSAGTFSPVFWTNDKTIIAVFGFTTDNDFTSIYEFDASTLRTVGTPFKGHTKLVTGLALSSDHALLASASNWDHTIKLWAFESRQLLASFDVQDNFRLVLSPDSCQLAYTVNTGGNYKICICDTPPDVLAQAQAHACVRILSKHVLFVC